jgi:hypothetical protein
LAKPGVRRTLLAVALTLVCAITLAGCDRNGVSAPYVISPGGVEITGPADGSVLNSQIIDVRGRAVVGTLVRVYVDGAFAGSGVAAITVPPQELGAFTVEDVDLGAQEGEKLIFAVAGDEQGNIADGGDTVMVFLDLTAPPADLEGLEGAHEVEPGVWQASGPWVDVYGRTDTTAIVIRIRWEMLDYLPDDYEILPGGPGEPDTVRARFRINSPVLARAGRDSSRTYAFQTIDEAGNYTQTFFTVRWTGAAIDCSDSGDAAERVIREIVGADTLGREVRLHSHVVAAGDTIYSMGGYHQLVARADSWLLCIDDMCGAHWKHDCRWVFVAVSDCLYDVIEAYWPPEFWADMVSVASWGCP